MPQRVSVPGLGVVEFPDLMPAHEISQAIVAHLQKTPGPSPQQPFWGLNNPNSVVGQLGDIGHKAFQFLGLNPFGTENPGDYQTGRLSPNGPFRTLENKTGIMPVGPGNAAFRDVYHGSPHVFDSFDMSKIGTGEGAQAYGHGLYFAESPGVAKQYATTLATPEVKIQGQSVAIPSWDSRLSPQPWTFRALADARSNAPEATES